MTKALETDVLFLLYDVARLMRTRADQRARRHGMTRAQWVILSWLERQSGISQSDLAGLVEVEPITVCRLVDRLEARGLVERRADPKDRRVKRLHLTREGEAHARRDPCLSRRAARGGDGRHFRCRAQVARSRRCCA